MSNFQYLISILLTNKFPMTYASMKNMIEAYEPLAATASFIGSDHSPHNIRNINIQASANESKLNLGCVEPNLL